MVATVYVALRLSAIGFHSVTPTEILSNPYLYATADQALATKLAVLLRYLGLLFFPYPLSSDARTGDSLRRFRESAAVAVARRPRGAGGVGRGAAPAPDSRSFAVFFYLATLALVSNLLIDIGAFMGERLTFHASLGFVVRSLVAAGARAPRRRGHRRHECRACGRSRAGRRHGGRRARRRRMDDRPEPRLEG